MSTSGVPNLGYICLSEAVHLRLGIEGKTYLVTLGLKNEVYLNSSKILKVPIKLYITDLYCFNQPFGHEKF